MTLIRGVDDKRPLLGLQAAPGQAKIAGPFAGADQGHERAGRGGVLNHAAPGGGQAHHLAHPVGDDFFQFGQRRARLPGQAQDAQPGAEIIAQDAGQGGVGRKVAEEAWVLPEREARQENRFQVAKDRIEALGLVGRRGRQPGLDLARSGARHYGQIAQSGAIISNPVDQAMADDTELFGGHA